VTGGKADGVVDIQTHFIPPQAARLLSAYRHGGGVIHGVGEMGADHPMCGLDTRLRAMDRAGVDVSVLSFAPIGTISDGGLARQLCRVANDGLLAACARYPDRFVATAMLPLPDTEAAGIELGRMRAEGAIRAVQIVAQTTQYQPDLPDFDDLFGMAADAGLPLLIHPAAGVADLSPLFDVYGLASGMHAMVSHALVAARLMQSGMLDRIPRLELILTHLGGILPFLIERLDDRAQGPAMLKPSDYLRTRIHVDGCGYLAGPALRCTIQTLGAGRLLVGSDWPSREIAPAIHAVRGLGLDAAQEAAILRGNALRWFDPARPRRPNLASSTSLSSTDDARTDANTSL
jgi:predicted TIM-barrel fold metal-dependent hydrolase